MVKRTTQSLRSQIAKLLDCTPHKEARCFCGQRLDWLDKNELMEVLEWLNDYFLALHEAADLEAHGARKTKACALAIDGAEHDWNKVYKIFCSAKQPKK